MAQYQQNPYREGEGEGKCGCHLPLRKGISWKVGDPDPKHWFGTVHQEKIVSHEVFDVGDHPWPHDMRYANGVESLLVLGSDTARRDLIKRMTPEQRTLLGIDPGGEIFPDFKQYETDILPNEYDTKWDNLYRVKLEIEIGNLLGKLPENLDSFDVLPDCLFEFA